jgi:Uma2 family endonuclease
MKPTASAHEIEYPDSDGRPMGESDLHRDWMMRIFDILRYRYRGQRVYVASDLLVYYEQGNPRRFVVPDVFVVLDCEPGRRDVFKIWQEGKAPDFVLEVTSRSTRRKDSTFKPQIYQQIGVREYFLYDPTRDYLLPPLQGFRREDADAMLPIPTNSDGSLSCETLGLRLMLDGLELVLLDQHTARPLPTEAEAAWAEKAAAQAARKSAEGRIAQLEAELEQLRRRLGQSDRGKS